MISNFNELSLLGYQAVAPYITIVVQMLRQNSRYMFRVQNSISKMGGHDGQPIPYLAGHLDKLVGQSL